MANFIVQVDKIEKTLRKFTNIIGMDRRKKQYYVLLSKGLTNVSIGDVILTFAKLKYNFNI